jgi:hypothetical protein
LLFHEQLWFLEIHDFVSMPVSKLFFSTILRICSPFDSILLNIHQSELLSSMSWIHHNFYLISSVVLWFYANDETSISGSEWRTLKLTSNWSLTDSSVDDSISGWIYSKEEVQAIRIVSLCSQESGCSISSGFRPFGGSGRVPWTIPTNWVMQ